jgi:hypothetical protein
MKPWLIALKDLVIRVAAHAIYDFIRDHWKDGF